MHLLRTEPVDGCFDLRLVGTVLAVRQLSSARVELYGHHVSCTELQIALLHPFAGADYVTVEFIHECSVLQTCDYISVYPYR